LLFLCQFLAGRSGAQIAIPTAGVINTIAGNGAQGYAGDNGLAVNAEMNHPLAVKVAANGDLYISDFLNNVIRRVASGTGVITTVAGNGADGYGGDGGAATSAMINEVSDFAFDSAGNLYIADSLNNRVREVNISTGVITTVAGNGTAGYAGDNGAATGAELNQPCGIAFDSAGDLLIADYGNNVVRMVSASTGVISTVVGSGTAGFSGDGGSALAAELNGPGFVALDAAGNIYIVECGSFRVRKVTPSGIISTVAGNGQADFSGDGGLATSAGMNPDGDFAVDPAGDIYFTDLSNRIRMVSAATGIITTVAGNGTAEYSGDNGDAAYAGLNNPQDVALDASGNLYIADFGNNCVRIVGAGTPPVPSGGTMVTVAGDGVPGYAGDNGLAVAAELNRPLAVRPDANGNLYISDLSNNVIRKVAAGTGVITTVAGNGTEGYGGDGGPATSAMVDGVSDFALDSAGNVYFADDNNNRIRKITVATGVITTVAGNGTEGYAGDNGPATSAELNEPCGIAFDSAGDLLIADFGNNVVRMVSASTGDISTVVGNGTAGYSGDGGNALAAELNGPGFISLDAAGNEYILDWGNSRVREVTPSGIVLTLAGNGQVGFSGDGGPATSAAMNLDGGVAADPAGDVYIADSDNNRVRLVSAATGIITTVVGNGTAGYSGDNGPAIFAELGQPEDVALDAAGNFYIADFHNHRVRMVLSSTAPAITLSVSPTTAMLYGGQTQQFSATVTNTSNTAVTWSISPVGTGTVDSSGLYTAPATISTQQTVTVTATSQANSAATASVAVTLSPPVAVSVSPATTTLYSSQTQQFSATVTNTSNAAVTWSISPAGTGTISSSGLYEAPATISTQQTVTVTATSQANSTSTGSVTLTLAPPCIGTGYRFERAIVIDHTRVSNSDQVNFPVLFSVTDADLATAANGGHLANSNGYDIVFSSDPAGVDLLNYEIEQYNPQTGQLVAWINFPTLSHTTDTAIYAFYGNPNITTSQQNPGGVWDSNYQAVYHLANVSSGVAADSTSNGNSGTATAVAAAQGIIDGAANFGQDNSTIATNYVQTAVTAYTIEGWINTTSSYVGIIVSDMGNGSSGQSLTFGLDGPDGCFGPSCGRYVGVPNPTGKLMFADVGDYSFIGVEGQTPLNDGKWHHVVGTWSGGAGSSITSGQFRLFVDGNTVSVPIPINDLSDTAPLTGLGGTDIGSGWGAYSGLLDEIRISNVVRSPGWIATEYNNQSSPSTFYAFGPESSVEVTPPTVSLYATQSEQFAATVLALGSCPDGVIWSMPPGSPGTLSTSGLYTAPASIAALQSVTITATSQSDPARSGVATVALVVPAQNPVLKVAAVTQPPYVTGSSQQFVATLQNRGGTPLSGVPVTFTVTGVNATTGSATTDDTGTATFSYTGTNTGNDAIVASASPDGENVTSNALVVSWLVPVQSISTTSVVGEFFLSDGSGTFDTLPTAAPAFTQIFPVINFNPPAGTIPENTSSVDVNSRPFTDVTTDLNGNYTGTIVAQGNGYQAGVAPMYTFQAVFMGSFTVASAGNVVFNFYDDDGFVLGIGNGATPVSGPSIDMPQVSALEQFPTMGAVDEGTSPVGNQVVVYFPAAGTYPYEVDYTECCGGQLVLTMTQGATSSTGIAPTGSLTLSPNSLSPLPVGGQQAFSVVASDASGAPVPDLHVSLVVTGADNLQLPAVTDSTGTATFTYQDVNPGTASVQAVAFISGMVAYSNAVSVPWTIPSTVTNASTTSGTLEVSVSAPNTLTLPDTLALSGSATDSGLATGDTITAAWSQVSGPGSVTFANAQEATTTASFSQAGQYVLQLAASDLDASGSVELGVTVNPAPAITQGWLASPANKAQVSGIVPITVASGETLQGGTLSYYPAGNPNDLTALNPDTTGSGEIGTLDTTTLPNGTYWIQLQATDSGGNFEYSLVMISVVGNYKPGRVTATVTDLVVPANGLPINIQRQYDSLNAGTSSDFGYGWSLGINTNLTVDEGGDVTFTLGGQRRTFYLTPQMPPCTLAGCLFPYYMPAFTPEPGFYGVLTGSGLGCPADILAQDGNLWACVGGTGFYTPPGYIYTDPTGTSYTISASGNLQSVADKNGNTLTVTAAGITSSTGLNVPFVRDSQGRITQITDPQGNQYLYGYDEYGNLASVTYPNTSQPSTYTYAANHYYTGGTDFRSNPLPTTAYYGPTDSDPNGLPLNGRLESTTDGLGETTSYAYNLATDTTTVTHPADATGAVGTAIMVYDGYGDLLSSTDPLGHTTTNVYDANHDVASTTDPLGHVTSYSYDQNGNRISTTYPATATSTNTTSYTEYNEFSEPASTTDELGNARAFNYDANFNPQSVVDTAGTLASFAFNSNGTMAAGAIGFDLTQQPSKASQFTYDANGNLASRTDALGRTTSYTYNNLGQKLTMTIPLPNSSTSTAAATTTYTYDQLGNLTQTAAPLGRTSSATYDANGNKISSTDARGKTTNYTYDALNRLTLTTYADSSTVSNTYDFRDNVIDSIDQNGHDTHNTYDLAGRLVSVTKAYGTSAASTTTYTYDNAGRKLTETDAVGAATTYTYDNAGNMLSVSGPGGAFQYAYDNARNRISSTDGNSHTTQYQYDVRKRLTQTSYPDGTTTVNAYDGPGNLSGVTDQAGNQVQYTYDAANQLHTVVQAASPNTGNNTNIYSYDNDGNLISLSDENAHVTQNGYDLLSDLTSKILPDGSSTETRTYDNNGNFVSLTHFNGVTTTYTYDNLNRLLSRATPGETTVSHTYTATGRYATTTDASGTTTYTYDGMDRLTSKATPEGTLSYTYDAAGHVLSIASSNTNGASVSYTWDSLNRLSTVVDNRLGMSSNTTTYAYDTASNLVTATYPNGVQSTFQYDQLNRLTSTTAGNTAYGYTIGPTGVRTGATELSGRAVAWSFDGIYRLTGETVSGDAHYNGSVSYGLDPVGNRLSGTSTLQGVSSGSFSYNADDELTGELYDADGNVTETGGKTFAYDSRNELISMNSGAISITYNGFGNRVAKSVSGVTTKYLVEDDVNPTGYPQVFDELTGSTVTRTYTFGLQRISENQIIDSAWTPSFYGYDGFGTVRQLTNSAGTVTDSYEYDAFGNEITSTGTTPNNYLYRGEQYDPDLGLYYLRARYMNPLTGRFMSRDPEDGHIGIPATLHKYLYSGGDPVNRIDPTGHINSLEFALIANVAAQRAAVAVVPVGIGACKLIEFTGLVLDDIDLWETTKTGEIDSKVKDIDIYLDQAEAYCKGFVPE
jgi:RHS repeat-associated protein